MSSIRHSLLLALTLVVGALATPAAELSGGAIITRTPLRNAPAKFAATGKGTVAFLGGSITEGNYFRPIVCTDLQSRFTDTQFTFITAGLSSTCSTAGAFRFSEDILAKGTPDVLFVEFAVNDDQDAHYTDAVCRRGMEGIIRQARRANPKMDIIMILFTNKGELDLVSAGQSPIPYAAHLAVAAHYGVPTVNIAKALANATTAGTFSWSAYGGDCHPNAAGAQFGADCVATLLDAEGWGTTTATEAAYPMPDRLDSGCYDYAHWVNPLRCVRDANFNYSTPNWSSLTSCRANYSSQPILWSTTPGSTFTLKFRGTKFGAFILAGSDAGILEISIDGDAYTSHDLYNTTYSRSLQFPYARVFREDLADAEHTATCRVSASKNSQSSGNGIRLFRVGVDGANDLTELPARTSTSGINWQDPTPIQGDTDVDTTGSLRYAWGTLPSVNTENNDVATINGVNFCTALHGGRNFCGTDIQLHHFSNLVCSTSYTWANGVASSSSLSARYRKLLGCGFYFSALPYRSTLTLQRLVPGREYLVQIWCSRGSAAASGETMTIDDAVDLATSGSASGAGQYVKGTFRARTETMSFPIHGSGAYACFNAIQVRDLSPAAKVTWENAKNVTADSDVRTDGVLRYAYGGSDATINGVPFKKGMSGSNIGPNSTEVLLSDAYVTALGSYNWSGYFKAPSLPSGCSANYRSLIDGGCYGGLFATGYLTLKNLIPGHRYLVQFWVNDSREHPGDDRYLKPDDGPIVSYRTANKIGQHCTGTFTAVADEHRIALIPYTRTSVQSGAQLSSFQLRDLTPGVIAWGSPQNISADSDIRTDGIGLYAYSFGGANAVVNGVVFRAQTTSAQGLGTSIELRGPVSINRSAFGSTASGNVSSAYTQLTRGSTYTDGGAVDIVLKDLVPGARYLVQLWVNDSRVVGPNRFLRIDGGVRLCERATSTFGQFITGTFTATATTHTFTLLGATLWSKDNYLGCTQFNAIQVRRLDTPGSNIEWQKNEISQSDYDFRTEGTLLYAYNIGGGAVTINNIPFAAAGIDPTNISFSNMTGAPGCFFDATDTNTSSGHQTMLKSGASTANTPAPTIVTLKALTPGHRYLVQLWVNDFRNVPGYDRYMVVDDAVVLNYKKTSAPARGDFATGLFTATATTQTFTLKAGTYTTVAAANQVNGIQVRDLGADPNATFYSEATTLPAAEIVATNNLIAASALTLGATDETLAVDGTIAAPTLALNGDWTNSTLAKLDAGAWQVNGNCPDLEHVVAGRGTLAFNTALPDHVAVEIAANATLAPLANSTPVISRLNGNGTLDFDGTLNLTGLLPSVFNGKFDGSVTVRKTGSASFTFGGTTTGSTTIDVQEGELFLTGNTPVAVTLAAGAVVDLAGGTRSLGAFTGAGTLRDGSVSGTLILSGDFTAEDFTLDATQGVQLLGDSRLTFIGNAELDEVTVRVQNPDQYARGQVFLATTGEFLGKPAFAFGKSGYSARLTEDGKGYTIYRYALSIFIR